jgi:two-component system, OmpR family, KDP operon response regulator KdpE
MRERISILTEDRTLASNVSDELDRAGFQTQILSTAPKYWQRARHFMSSVLIVDLDTMGQDALAQCRRLGSMNTARMIALSQIHQEDIVVEAFAAGVDDYMAKPVSTPELAARVEALLRRRHSNGGFRITRQPICPDVTLDTDAHALYVRGRRMKLTPIEYSLLECLVNNAGQLVSRGTLLRYAWGDGKMPSVGSLNIYIYYLRHKIERDPRHPEHILTKWGAGYYLASEDRPRARTIAGEMGVAPAYKLD